MGEVEKALDRMLSRRCGASHDKQDVTHVIRPEAYHKRPRCVVTGAMCGTSTITDGETRLICHCAGCTEWAKYKEQHYG